MNGSSGRRDTIITVALCYLSATLEGLDLQSMGIAGPKLIKEFHLQPAQFGNAASMSLVGLLIGSVIGGRLADRVGRKNVLVVSFILLGLFSLLTTLTHDYPSLLAVRLLVGLGLGGAFPNLIALCSEAASSRRKATMVALMYAGIPMGTVVSTLMVLYFGAAFQWRWIFYIGGLGPLIVTPLLQWVMPESAGFRKAIATDRSGRRPVREVLFGEGRAATTVLLWLGFFFTLLIVNLLTNWLNQLMSARGLDRAQSTTVLLAFGVGSIAGSLSLGLLSDSALRRWTAVLAYSGLVLSLVGLSQFTAHPLLVASGFGAGFFVVGAQLINYAMAPSHYPLANSGTGVGWAVAVGRAGSICGPLLGGLMLQAGLSASAVLVAFLPGILIAAIAASLLLFRKPAPLLPVGA